MRIAKLAMVSGLGVLALAVCLSGQEPKKGAAVGRGAGGGRSMVPPLEETGFTPIFDGKSMAGWDGDPNFWRVEDGAIVGQTLTDKQPKQNTFCIWRGGTP